MSSTTILIVEDQPLLRMGLKLSLEKLNRYVIVGEAGDGESAVSEAHRLQPQIVLMDVGLPRMDGVEATWRIKQALPQTRIVMFTSHTAPADVTAALGAGADGYCAKDSSIEQIAQAIDAVMRGESWLDPAIADSVVSGHAGPNNSGVELSNMELEVLQLIKDGLDNRELADKMQTSTELIGRVMHNIIHRFVEKTNSERGEADRQVPKFSKEWLRAFSPDVDERMVFADKYQIECLIGAGGKGSVFKAKHLYMDRVVALKLLRPEFSSDPLAMRNFQREATAIAALHHVNIIDVYDFGVSQDQPFLVMEYVEGRDLADILKETTRLPARRLVNLCLQVCAGLAEANRKGVIHCDLKPSNILIMGSDPHETVKLVDFGLAQIITPSQAGQSKMTEKFCIEGTPYYMSPEQISGKQLDIRSDIYSLGCIMFKALTGLHLFEGETVIDTFAMHMKMNPPTISSVYPEGNFPPELEFAISNMVRKDPAHRLQSMDEVEAALLAGLIQAPAA